MNNSSTSNTSGIDRTVEYQREAFRTYQLIPLSIIIVVGFVGNILVIYAGFKKPNRQKYSTNSFILNLAISDLGMVVFFVPIIFIEYTVGLHVSNFTCQYIIPVREVFALTSVNTVAVLAAVRLAQVCKDRVLSMRFTHLIIGGMWLFAYTTVSLPLSAVFKHTDENTCDPIWVSEKARKIHLAYMNAVLYVPLFVTTTCYVCIIIKMRKFNHRVNNNNSENNELESKSQKLSALLLMLIVTIWLGVAPYIIHISLKAFGNTYTKWPIVEWSIMSVLFCSTSAVNPILILLANKDYRREIRQSFYKRRRIAPLPFVEKREPEPPIRLNTMISGE